MARSSEISLAKGSVDIGDGGETSGGAVRLREIRSMPMYDFSLLCVPDMRCAPNSSPTHEDFGRPATAYAVYTPILQFFKEIASFLVLEVNQCPENSAGQKDQVPVSKEPQGVLRPSLHDRTQGGRPWGPVVAFLGVSHDPTASADHHVFTPD